MIIRRLWLALDVVWRTSFLGGNDVWMAEDCRQQNRLWAPFAGSRNAVSQNEKLCILRSRAASEDPSQQKVPLSSGSEKKKKPWSLSVRSRVSNPHAAAIGQRQVASFIWTETPSRLMRGGSHTVLGGSGNPLASASLGKKGQTAQR